MCCQVYAVGHPAVTKLLYCKSSSTKLCYKLAALQMTRKKEKEKLYTDMLMRASATQSKLPNKSSRTFCKDHLDMIQTALAPTGLSFRKVIFSKGYLSVGYNHCCATQRSKIKGKALEVVPFETMALARQWGSCAIATLGWPNLG